MSRLSSGYFQVPNHVIDSFMSELSHPAFKCLMIILRKTHGWEKSKDKISISQFMEVGGMAKHTVLKALKELESFGLVKKNIGEKQNSLSTFELTDNFNLGEFSSAGNAPCNKCTVQELHGAGNAPSSAGNAPLSSAGNAPQAVQEMHPQKTIKNTNKNNIQKKEIFSPEKRQSDFFVKTATQSWDQLHEVELQACKKLQPELTREAVESMAKNSNLSALQIMQGIKLNQTGNTP